MKKKRTRSNDPLATAILGGAATSLGVSELTSMAKKLKRSKNPGKGAFKRCVAKVAAKGKARSPRAVCATAGRKKYGRKVFESMAAAGRRKAAAKRGKRNPGRSRKNPAELAAERYEYFHGHPPKKTTTFTTRQHHHSVTAGVGKLKKMKIAAANKLVVTLEGFKGALLSQNEMLGPGERAFQLFIKGGDQSVNLADFGISKPHNQEFLGALVEISYETNKTHLTPETGGDAVYSHRFGKGAKRLPMVVYDVRNKQLHIVGGEYNLLQTGIVG